MQPGGRRSRRWPLGVISSLVAVIAGSAHASGTIEALELPGATATWAMSLSANGSQAAGISLLPTGSRAFVWDAGGITAIPAYVDTPPPGATDWWGHGAVSAWLSNDGQTLVVEQRSYLTADTSQDFDVLGIAWRGGTPTRFARLEDRFYGSSWLHADIAGVSADGSVAAGFSTLTAHGIPDDEAFEWDTVSAVESTPPYVCPPGYDPPGVTYAEARAFDVSADGSTVVGFYTCLDSGSPDVRIIPYRWTSAGLQTASLGGQRLPVDPNSMQISENGSIVVGSFYAGIYEEGFYWPVNSPWMALAADLPGMTGALPRISHLSDDGHVLIGTAEDGSGRIAYRWEAGQLTWLGDLPGGAYSSSVTATTPDGNVIVGVSETASGSTPFYWTPQEGMRPLTDVLSIDNGIDLTDWTLDEVVDLSDDGRVMMGNGQRLGTDVAFRVGLSAPPVPGPAASFIGFSVLASLLGWVGSTRSRRPGRSPRGGR